MVKSVRQTKTPVRPGNPSPPHSSLPLNKHQLDSARLVKGDTQTIKDDLAETTHQCWSIPREYIRANPACILSLVALEMMSNGDPAVKDPIGELETLFRSLTGELRTSPAGKKIAARLVALRQGAKSAENVRQGATSEENIQQGATSEENVQQDEKPSAHIQQGPKPSGQSS